MQANQPFSAQDVMALVDARKLSHVKVAVADIDGVLRGKYLARDKFESCLKGGLSMCNVVLGWDSQDQLY
ncbi:MAG TPA: glutamine synthetase, partial [Ramlibacter sp.]